MRTRASFVSNSSSSSFVVVPGRDARTPVIRASEDAAERDRAIRGRLGSEIALCRHEGRPWTGILPDGERAFGWQTCNYSDLPSKWNWMVLQACYGLTDGRRGRMTDEHRRAVDSYLAGLGLDPVDWGALESVVGDCSTGTYIDHQSIDADWTFLEIGLVGIAEWLYDPQCLVQNGNDNDY